jgi:hypothetical protein
MDPKLEVPKKITVWAPPPQLPYVDVVPLPPVRPLTDDEELAAMERENELNEARIRYEVLRREAEQAKTETPPSFIQKYKRDAMWTSIGMAVGALILKFAGC